jgi:simple sugar transport system ATP-binding protein
VTSTSPPAISARDVRKRYGQVEALRGVSLDVHHGEVVALVGDNGAGKSTLLKVICGAVRPDEGTITLSGQRVEQDAIRASARLGLGMVYQDLALAPDLRVFENLYLGHDLKRRGLLGRLGVLDRAAMAEDTRACLAALGQRLPSVYVPVRELSGGQRQTVAIARAVRWATSAVIMDEPTAALGVEQTGRVSELIRSTADAGLAVLLVSHDMPHVLEIADRIVVLRHGKVVADLIGSATTIPGVVAAMLGSSVSTATEVEVPA